MYKIWQDKPWDEYQDWIKEDRKACNRIDALLKDIERNGVDVGIGNPEPLKHGLSGCYSRHINDKNRLIYRLTDRNELEIVSCKGHYKDH